MITRLASKYISSINYDTRETKDEIKKVIRLRFLDFCEGCGVENTIGSYREYRSVCRAMLGFDLPKARPTKKMSIVEHNLELF